MTPTTAITAPPYRADALAAASSTTPIAKLVAFTFAQNLTGLPAAPVPCGYDAAGLPVGLQVIAPCGARPARAGGRRRGRAPLGTPPPRISTESARLAHFATST